MNPNVISLGAWCRPAYHIRNFFGYDRAYPHDWNITSYAALLHTLADDYEPRAELKLSQCSINQFDSVTDGRSGVIFQHDLQKQDLVLAPSGDALADDEANQAVLDQVRSKTAALHDRMRQTCASGPVIFVRWIRHGHPDGEWPEAFTGESPDALHAALTGFCGHDRIRLAHVTSGSRDADDEGPLFDLAPMPFGATATVYELPHTNWTGDAAPWHALLARLAQDWQAL